MTRGLNKDEFAHIAEFCDDTARANLRLTSAEIANEIPVTRVYIRNIIFYNAIVNTAHNRGMQIYLINCKFYGLNYFLYLLNMRVLRITMFMFYAISLISLIISILMNKGSMMTIIINIVALSVLFIRIHQFISAYISRGMDNFYYLLMFAACSMQYPALIFSAIFCNAVLIGGFSLYNLFRYGPWALLLMFSSQNIYILRN